jgi:hypothetical protein
VEEELMLWELDFGIVGKDNALSALFERGFEKRDDVGRIGGQAMGEFFVI